MGGFGSAQVRPPYQIAGLSRIRFLENSAYLPILKSIFSSIMILRMIAGAKINTNTHRVTQLKKHMRIPALATIMPAIDTIFEVISTEIFLERCC